MRKHRGYWNENTIKEHAKECSSWEEFKGRYSQGYKLGMKLGIIHDIFKLSRKPNNYWTEDLVRVEAIKYNSRVEFKQKAQAASNAAYDLKIMNELFPSKKNPNGYWTEENIRIEASKFKSKSEFDKNSKTAYRYAIKLGIIDDLNFEAKGSLAKRCIYAIEFDDNSSYIGLTYNFERRISNHFNDHSRSSSARLHLEANPEIKYVSKMLTGYINKNDAIIMESVFLNQYKVNGFNVLNKAKTGGLGGTYRKWNEKKVIEAALNYKTASEFKYSKDCSAYCYATRNKITHKLKYRK